MIPTLHKHIARAAAVAGVATLALAPSLARTADLQRPVAATRSPSTFQQFLLSKTHVELLTMGSPGKEFEQWGRALTVTSPPPLFTLRWSTDETGAATGEWSISTPDAGGNPVVVASGPLAKVPAPGSSLMFNVPASFLSPKPPATPKSYYLRVTSLDAQKKPLGAPSLAIVLTQGPEGTPVKFDDDMGGEPKGYVEPGHPQVKLVRYDALDETHPGALRLIFQNPTNKTTDAVDARLADLTLVARQKEGLLRVPALAPGAKHAITFTLVPQLTKGSLTVEKDWQEWRARYSKDGVNLLVGTNKIGSPYVQWHQPPVYSGKAPVSSCADRKVDGDEEGFDCGGSCQTACVDCFAEASKGSGDAAKYFSIGSNAVKLAADVAKFEYLNYLKKEKHQTETLDYFEPSKVGKDAAAHHIILAVARYVDKHTTYFIDDTDDWSGASAERTILESGERIGLTGHSDTTLEKCPTMYCGDCEDHAFLRFALLRALGIGRRCAWVADHHNSVDQGQSACPNATKKNSGGHTYNLVYWKGKYRILDYGTKPRTGTTSNCSAQHATDNIYDDIYGEWWGSDHISPRGKPHHNYPGNNMCGGPLWNWRTYYTDVCP